MSNENKTEKDSNTNILKNKIKQDVDVAKVKKEKVSNGASKVVAKSVYGDKYRKKVISRKFKSNNYKKDEYEQKILDIARVTRVVAGGKRMRFRVCVAIGDKKGKVGIGLGKGTDVAIAVTKAVNIAKNNLIDILIVNNTIPHEVRYKFGASKLLFKPARKGRGIIAGGVIRVIMNLAGIKNITSKILGTTNKVSNAKCAIEALKTLKQEKRLGVEKNNKIKK